MSATRTIMAQKWRNVIRRFYFIDMGDKIIYLMGANVLLGQAMHFIVRFGEPVKREIDVAITATAIIQPNQH